MTSDQPEGAEHLREFTLAQHWRPLLRELSREIRVPVRRALGAALAAKDGERARLNDVTEVVGTGAGDITFAIDVVAEDAVERWFQKVAANGPLSLLTEDTGWQHRGPSPSGDVQELSGFDHGGPRIALDPIDGTRNIMHDLRSAWVVVSMAGPGPDEPQFKDLCYGAISEIPDSRGAEVRELDAIAGQGAHLRRLSIHADGEEREVASGPLCTDDEVRLDRGYFPFFGFHPSCRADVAALGFDVLQRVVASHPGLNLSTVFDDQYISSGGQLALLALGGYRSIVDARDALGQRTGRPTQTAKPYDMAGAALVALEAGCVVVAPDGAPLNFPLDAATPTDFAGFHNRGTADAMLPHLRAAIDRIAP